MSSGPVALQDSIENIILEIILLVTLLKEKEFGFRGTLMSADVEVKFLAKLEPTVEKNLLKVLAISLLWSVISLVPSDI